MESAILNGSFGGCSRRGSAYWVMEMGVLTFEQGRYSCDGCLGQGRCFLRDEMGLSLWVSEERFGVLRDGDRRIGIWYK